MASKRKIKVLVIDDSAYNRRVLSEFFTAESDITVVGKACDGEEGLQLAMAERPDVITLDLEMPRMDGFTFLRILMAKSPVPVIVISAYAEKDKVFRALELGALDFVAKPTHRISPMIMEIRRDVVKKVRLAGTLSPDSICPYSAYAQTQAPVADPTVDPPPPIEQAVEPEPIVESRSSERRLEDLTQRVFPPAISPTLTDEPTDKPDYVVAIAASTGGPTALTRILTTLPANINAAILVVQHMPARFTTTFAERLDRQCALRVKEVGGVEILRRGVAYLSPGDVCIEICPVDAGFCVVAGKPKTTDRYVPSADRLFSSVAAAMGEKALAVVLTGMGDDSADGVREIAAAGGMVVAESEATAVVFGMPQAAIQTGVVSQITSVHNISAVIKSFAV